MRTFIKFSPQLIAKYVASFFKGSFIVAEQGTFTFDGGKVIIDGSLTENQRQMGYEINRVIASFLASRRNSMEAHYK